MDLRPIRHRVLRPHQSLEDCVYPGDEHPNSLHVGAYFQEELVCIASFFPQKSERFSAVFPYRLRGMATLEGHRGRGIAAQVLKYGELQIQEMGCTLLWCNARTTAEGYYLKLGYQSFPDIFEIEGIGPHKVMYKPLE